MIIKQIVDIFRCYKFCHIQIIVCIQYLHRNLITFHCFNFIKWVVNNFIDFIAHVIKIKTFALLHNTGYCISTCKFCVFTWTKIFIFIKTFIPLLHQCTVCKFRDGVLFYNNLSPFMHQTFIKLFIYISI